MHNNPETHKKWLKENPEKARYINYKSFIKRRYGTTPEEVELLKKQQNNKCSICGCEFVEGNQYDEKCACIDHSHSQKIIRGILCRNCNLMLGYAKDKIENLVKAIEYLNKFNETPR